MSTKKYTKSIGIISVIVAMLFATVCLGVINWSYLVETSTALTETKIGILRKQGVRCSSTTCVEPWYDCEVTTFLQTLDEDGDWVTVTAWEDIDNEIAAIAVEYEVPDGTYRLYNVHKALDPDDHSIILESHDSYSNTLVLD